MPVKVESILMLPGLSPVGGKAIEARFDAACMSSDGGLLALREIEQRLAIASRLAACLRDPRDPSRVVHGLDEIIRTRMLMISAGYEDGNDADRLRHDPMFKLAMGRLPDDADLCSQPTISRLENLPDARALLRMGRAMVDHYCQSFRHVPRRIVLDIDDTFDAVHGGQQLRLFNAHHDEYGFQPIVVFDGEGRMIAAVLRPASRPSGKQIVRWLHRLITAIRGNWPQVEIMLRADSHYCTPEVLRFCRARGLDYTLGVAPTSTLRKHVVSLEESTAARWPPLRMAQSCAGSRTFTTVRPVGTGWSASSLVLRPGRKGRTRASSSPASATRPAAPSTRIFIAHGVRRRTTSRRGRRIWPPTGPRAVERAPTSCACSCMSVPTG
jgi:hypothetical protein